MKRKLLILASFLFALTIGFGQTNDMQVVTVTAPGLVSNIVGSPQPIMGLIKNVGTAAHTNIVVTLSVTGANPYTITQNIASLAVGAQTTVTFTAFNPTVQGVNTITILVPPDDVLTNNSVTWIQNVTCNIFAMNPPTGANTFSYQSVGFGTGEGVLALPLTNPNTTTISGLSLAISNYALNVGNTVYGLLLSSAGVTLAATSPIVITSTMLSTFQSASFATPQVLTGGTTYYYGFAQTANASGYYPAGTYNAPLLDPNFYYYTDITGGALAPVGTNFGYFGVNVIYQNTLNVTASAAQTITCGASTTVTALSTANYSWSTGATTSSIVVSPTTSSVYTVTANNGVCTVSSTAAIGVTPLPLTVTSQTTVVCGNSAVLTAQSAANYSWSTGSSNTSISVTPSVSTVYTVTTTGAGGCSTSKTASVTITPFPINAVASSSAVCLNSAVTLTGTGANTYVWSVSSGSVGTGSVFTATPTLPTNYLVTGFNTIGCSNSTNITIFIKGLPLVSINTLVQAICLGSPITMTASGASTFTWATSGVPTTTVITDTPVANTIYTVAGTDANGCVNTATTEIDVNTVMLSISGSTAICSGKTGTLVANGADSYVWNNSTPFQEYHVTPNATTVYTVEGTNASNGCTATQTISLIVNNRPPVQAASSKTAICTGESMTFNGSGADTYTWSGISITGTAAMNSSITVSPSIPATNVYTLSGTDANGCTGTSTLVLRIDACTGIKQTSASDKGISIFPNPNNGLFTVIIDNADNASIEIYNSLGAMIRRQAVNNDKTNIDLTGESTGIYLVYVIGANKTVSVSKIVKQ